MGIRYFVLLPLFPPFLLSTLIINNKFYIVDIMFGTKKKENKVTSSTVTEELQDILDIFNTAIYRLDSLAEVTTSAIEEQVAIIENAQKEKEALSAALQQIGGVKQNISNLVSPAI